jgi:hypothetical protein
LMPSRNHDRHPDPDRVSIVEIPSVESGKTSVVYVDEFRDADERARAVTINPLVVGDAERISSSMYPVPRPETLATIQQMKETIERCRMWYGQQAPAWWLSCWGGCWDRCWGAGENTTARRRRSAGVPWWSPAGYWYVALRIIMTLVVLLAAYGSISGEFQKLFVWCMAVPGIFAALSAIAAACSSLLERKFDEAIAEAATLKKAATGAATEAAVGGEEFGAPSPRMMQHQRQHQHQHYHQMLLEPKDVADAARSSVRFVAVWAVYGVVMGVVKGATNVGGNLIPDALAVVGTCAYIPSLGAVLFVLSLDVARARKRVAVLA